MHGFRVVKMLSIYIRLKIIQIVTNIGTYINGTRFAPRSKKIIRLSLSCEILWNNNYWQNCFFSQRLKSTTLKQVAKNKKPGLTAIPSSQFRNSPSTLPRRLSRDISWISPLRPRNTTSMRTHKRARITWISKMRTFVCWSQEVIANFVRTFSARRYKTERNWILVLCVRIQNS